MSSKIRRRPAKSGDVGQDRAPSDTQAELKSREKPAKTWQIDGADTKDRSQALSTPQRRQIWLLLLAYHLTLACLNNTYFQADEYWQATEVAHRVVFGYGYLTWEWRGTTTAAATATTWSALSHSGIAALFSHLSQGPIRSVLHPLLFTPVFYTLRSLGLDGSFTLMTVGPRMVQAVLSTVGAVYTWRLARMASRDEKVANAALSSMLLSPYYAYTATRTFSNTTEASLCSAALFYWFRRHHQEGKSNNAPSDLMGDSTRDTVKALTLAALACLLRPTNAVVWIFLVGRGLLRHPHRPHRPLLLLALCTLIAVASLALTAAADTLFHSGNASLPLVPFALQNIYHSVSLFYGSNAWHWYLSQGLPVVVMCSLPLSVVGSVRAYRSGGHQHTLLREIALLVAWTIALYSLLGHKEWRFLQPIVPLLHILAGNGWHGDGAVDANGKAVDPERRLWTKQRLSVFISRLRLVCKRALYITSPLITLYLTAFHCIGQGYTLPRHIRRLAHDGALSSLGFLMPCHSTPWQSHFHLPHLDDRMWFVTCEPPRGGQGDVGEYKDESDYFYEDPVRYLQVALGEGSRATTGGWTPAHAAAFELNAQAQTQTQTQTQTPTPAPPLSLPPSLPPAHLYPSHLVLFDALLKHPRYGPQLQRFLLHDKGYRVERRIWNSLFHDDPRRWGDILVLQRGDDRG